MKFKKSGKGFISILERVFPIIKRKYVVTVSMQDDY